MLGAQVAWILAPGPVLGLILLNWATRRDTALEVEPEPDAPTIENLIAHPLHDFTAPQRSGGPSLF